MHQGRLLVHHRLFRRWLLVVDEYFLHVKRIQILTNRGDATVRDDHHEVIEVVVNRSIRFHRIRFDLDSNAIAFCSPASLASTSFLQGRLP